MTDFDCQLRPDPPISSQQLSCDTGVEAPGASLPLTIYRWSNRADKGETREIAKKQRLHT